MAAKQQDEKIISYPNGLEERLKKVIRACNIAIAIGLVMLCGLYFTTGTYVRVTNQQNKIVDELNRFKSATRDLSLPLQAYISTGDDTYFSLYEEELQRGIREKSFESLNEQNLTDSEKEELLVAYNLLESISHYEELAANYMKAGESEKAKNIIFGKEYQGELYFIAENTEKIIEEITQRIDHRRFICQSCQLIAACFFIASFFYIVGQGVGFIAFTRRKLLRPVLEVSKQMKALQDGNLHQDIELEIEDTEVGQMVQDIQNMKDWMCSMIYEISEVLSKMGDGYLNLTMEREYKGDFEEIKESFFIISDLLKESVQVIQEAAYSINNGATQVTEASSSVADACCVQAMKISEMLDLISELGAAIQSDTREAHEAEKISKAAEDVLAENGHKLELLQDALMELIDYTSELKNNPDLADVMPHIDKTLDIVEKVSVLAYDSSNNMEEVILGTKETSDRVNDMVARLQSESDYVGQMEEYASEVASFVDDNSATAEQTAAISADQKKQVELLVRMLNHFHV